MQPEHGIRPGVQRFRRSHRTAWRRCCLHPRLNPETVVVSTTVERDWKFRPLRADSDGEWHTPRWCVRHWLSRMTCQSLGGVCRILWPTPAASWIRADGGGGAGRPSAMAPVVVRSAGTTAGLSARGRLLVRGEAHEPRPRPRRHSAEHVQPRSRPPSIRQPPQPRRELARRTLAAVGGVRMTEGAMRCQRRPNFDPPATAEF